MHAQGTSRGITATLPLPVLGVARNLNAATTLKSMHVYRNAARDDLVMSQTRLVQRSQEPHVRDRQGLPLGVSSTQEGALKSVDQVSVQHAQSASPALCCGAYDVHFNNILDCLQRVAFPT